MSLSPGWVVAPLLDVTLLHDNRRVPLNQAQRSTMPGSYPYFGANGQVDTVGDYLFDGGYILLAEDGGYFDDPRRGVAYRARGRFWVNNHAHILQSEGEILDSYLCPLLNSLDWMDFVSGTTRLKLTQGGMQRVRVPIPPLAEQRRIVAKLDALTARLARARKEVTHALKRLVGMREAALLRASDGSLSADWRMADANFHSSADALSKVRLERGRESRPDRRVTTSVAPSPLPRGWAWISADELAANEKYSIGIGPFGSDLVKADYRESGIRLVFVRDVRAKSFGSNGAKYVSHDKAEQLKAHVVVAGDVLVTKMGDPPGDVAIYSGEERGVVTADCIRVRPHPALVLAEFLELAIRFPCVQSQILAATKGVAQQKISLDSFRRMAIPVPPIGEQREIIDQLSSTAARADRLEAEAQKALALIDRLEAAILAKAFRGELVPQDPNDEPASVLLERIRARRAAEPKAKRGRRPKLAS